MEEGVLFAHLFQSGFNENIPSTAQCCESLFTEMLRGDVEQARGGEWDTEVRVGLDNFNRFAFVLELES